MPMKKEEQYLRPLSVSKQGIWKNVERRGIGRIYGMRGLNFNSGVDEDFIVQRHNAGRNGTRI